MIHRRLIDLTHRVDMNESCRLRESCFQMLKATLRFSKTAVRCCQNPAEIGALAQASLDATNVLLALSDADVDTKRTRGARQLLAAVTGGRHE
jgi:hypothetical protein